MGGGLHPCLKKKLMEQHYRNESMIIDTIKSETKEKLRMTGEYYCRQLFRLLTLSVFSN